MNKNIFNLGKKDVSLIGGTNPGFDICLFETTMKGRNHVIFIECKTAEKKVQDINNSTNALSLDDVVKKIKDSLEKFHDMQYFDDLEYFKNLDFSDLTIVFPVFNQNIQKQVKSKALKDKLTNAIKTISISPFLKSTGKLPNLIFLTRDQLETIYSPSLCTSTFFYDGECSKNNSSIINNNKNISEYLSKKPLAEWKKKEIFNWCEENVKNFDRYNFFKYPTEGSTLFFILDENGDLSKVTSSAVPREVVLDFTAKLKDVFVDQRSNKLI